jgi:hypothetical protein
MRWDLGVGVQGKAVDAGTTGAAEGWLLACSANPRADAPDLLASPLATGEALLHRGHHGAGELRGVIDQRIIPRGHGGAETRFQVSQVAQLTDDPPADLLEDCRNVSIGGRLPLDKPGLEPLVGAIQRDPLKEDHMKMEFHIDGTAKTLDKRDRPRLDFGPLDTSCDCLVHVILPDRGADDRMDLGGEVL